MPRGTFSGFNYVIYARFRNEDEHQLQKQRQHLSCGFSSNFIQLRSFHQKRKMVFKSNQHFFNDLGKQQLAFFSLCFGRWCKDINTFFRFSFSPMMEIWWKHHKWLFCLNRKRSNHHFKYLSRRLKQDLYANWRLLIFSLGISTILAVAFTHNIFAN